MDESLTEIPRRQLKLNKGDITEFLSSCTYYTGHQKISLSLGSDCWSIFRYIGTQFC